jgi:hypothetical protein
MPRKRRKTRQRLGFNSGHIFQLLTGFDFFGDGFGDDVRAMKAAWPILKAEVMRLWKSRGRPGQPWGCKMFDKKISA